MPENISKTESFFIEYLSGQPLKSQNHLVLLSSHCKDKGYMKFFCEEWVTGSVAPKAKMKDQDLLMDISDILEVWEEKYIL